MKKRIIYTLILLGSALSLQAQKLDLGLHLKQGEKYLQKSSSKMNISQTMAGQSIDMTMTVDGDVQYIVKSIEGNNYNFDVSYLSLALGMVMPQMTVDFSSEKEDNEMSQILSSMKGKVFTVVMSDKGKILEVKNTDNLFSDFDSKFENMPAAQKEQMKAQLKQAFGAKTIKTSLEISTAIFPDKKVKIGESWTSTSVLEGQMPASVNSTYTLKEAGEDYYLITGTGTLDTDEENYSEMQGMQMAYDLKGSITSTIKIDKSTGWVIETTAKQNLKGTSKLKGNANMPNGMSIPMTIESETTITD